MPSSSAGATDKAPDRDFQQAQAPAAPHHEPAGTVNAPNDVVKTSASTGTGTASSTATSILSDLIIAAPVATAAPQKNPDGKITPADESPVAVVALMDSQKSGSVQRQAALQKPAEIETGTDNGNGEPSPEIDRDVATDKPAPAAVSKQKQPAPKSDGNAEKSPALGALSVPPEPSAALQNGHKLAEAVVTPAVKTKTAMAVAAVPAAADKTTRTHPSANAEAKSVSTQTLPAASLPVGATDLAMAKPAAAATLVNPADEGVRRTTFSEVSGVVLEVLTSLFVGAYERGNVDELMNLFVEEARANNKRGKTNIRKDYETFFSSTRSREILLRHLRWKRDGRSASGHGLYQVQIQGNQGTQNYTGTIRFEVKKKDKRVLITQLIHKALF
jgi:hypothetical protein